MYWNAGSRVRVFGSFSDDFLIQAELAQGSVLSPIVSRNARNEIKMPRAKIPRELAFSLERSTGVKDAEREC